MPGQKDDRESSILDCDVFELADRILDAYPETNRLADFGPYRTEQRIDSGGMGEVWRAYDKDARRAVAIKIPRYLADPKLRERFAREVYNLGKLEHRFIARLYDHGICPDGTPYFAMEFVVGKPLDEYCRQRQLSIDQRMRLFQYICEGVQYAHSRLVVHRDLKPSNILVLEDGTPKLLDFGIAKQLEDIDDTASLTRTDLRFTRAYASPEQILNQPVGTHMDVYALGVILYELLAGKPPYDFDKCTPGQAETIITAGPEPPKPSTSKNRVAARKAAWNDLDLLCLKALRKDLSRRYASVVELSQDIDRYLRGEPLRARPDTLGYRLSKFVRRHRQPILASTAVVLFFIVLISFFALRLAKERNAALAEAARTRRIQRFMLSLFGAGDKAAAPSKDLRVVTLLDMGAKEANDLRADPETQAELYQTLGRMYQMLGDARRAENLQGLALEKMKTALGPANPKVAEILVQMGLLQADQAKFKQAERLVQEGLQLASRTLPPEDPIVLRAKSALGEVWAASHENEKAIAILDPIVRSEPAGEDGPFILLESLTNLGEAEMYAGHYERAEMLHRHALELDRKIYGNAHPRLAVGLADLGAVEATLGRYAESERLYRESLQIGTAWYGEAQPDLLVERSILATVLVNEGKLGEADSLLRNVLPLEEQVFGKNHAYVAFALDSLGKLAYKRGDLDAAQTYFERSLTISKVLWGDTDFNTGVVKSDLSDAFVGKKQYLRAEELLSQAVSAVTRQPRPGNPSVGVVQVKFGRALVLLKRYRDAEAPLTAGYAILAPKPSVFQERLEQARKDLVTVYTALHEPDQAAKFRSELATNRPK